MGQKDGEKWTAAADLQPTISKSDSLLDEPRGRALFFRIHARHGLHGVSKGLK